jgi:hypothetical protein
MRRAILWPPQVHVPQREARGRRHGGAPLSYAVGPRFYRIGPRLYRRYGAAGSARGASFR